MQRVQKSLHVLNLPSMLLMTEERWALAIMHCSHASSSLSALPARARCAPHPPVPYDVVKPGIMDSCNRELWPPVPGVPGGACPSQMTAYTETTA